MTLGISNSQIPVITNNGARVRVLCGSTAGITCDVKIPQELTILHIALEPGKEFRHILPAHWSGTLFALEGRFDVMTAEETFELEEGMAIAMAFSEYNESVVFTGLTCAQLIFVSGQPVQETQPVQGIFGREPHLVPAGTGVKAAAREVSASIRAKSKAR
jgi:redox-sensitive bicupin YhaK (pirin superfamily)